MPQIIKNIPEPKQDEKNIPLSLLKTKQNNERAGYIYKFDPYQEEYINYNTLRNKRVAEKTSNEVLDIVKMYRLQDRETGKEYIVWYQVSKTYDYNNNLIPCPVDEQYGVVDNPQTNKILDSSNQVTDIVPVETQIEYYIEFNPEELRKLIARSRNPQNIACYIGFTRPIKVKTNDFVDNKKRINNQNMFLDATFDELMSINENSNKKETFNTRLLKSRYGSNKEQGRTKENERSQIVS